MLYMHTLHTVQKVWDEKEVSLSPHPSTYKFLSLDQMQLSVFEYPSKYLFCLYIPL